MEDIIIPDSRAAGFLGDLLPGIDEADSCAFRITLPPGSSESDAEAAVRAIEDLDIVSPISIEDLEFKAERVYCGPCPTLIGYIDAVVYDVRIRAPREHMTDCAAFEKARSSVDWVGRLGLGILWPVSEIPREEDSKKN